MVLIGVIVGLAIIALMLASVSLLLIRRSRTSNMATFAKTGSLKGNIYTHQPNTETIRVCFILYFLIFGVYQMNFRT